MYQNPYLKFCFWGLQPKRTTLVWIHSKPLNRNIWGRRLGCVLSESHKVYSGAWKSDNPGSYISEGCSFYIASHPQAFFFFFFLPALLAWPSDNHHYSPCWHLSVRSCRDHMCTILPFLNINHSFFNSINIYVDLLSTRHWAKCQEQNNEQNKVPALIKLIL